MVGLLLSPVLRLRCFQFEDSVNTGVGLLEVEAFYGTHLIVYPGKLIVYPTQLAVGGNLLVPVTDRFEPFFQLFDPLVVPVLDKIDALSGEESNFGVFTLDQCFEDAFEQKVRIGAANFHGLKYIYPLLNPTKGWIAYILWSHKIIRWFLPLLLGIVFFSNLFLLNEGRVYCYLIGIQFVFYFNAFLGFICYVINEKYKIYHLH